MGGSVRVAAHASGGAPDLRPEDIRVGTAEIRHAKLLAILLTLLLLAAPLGACQVRPPALPAEADLRGVTMDPRRFASIVPQDDIEIRMALIQPADKPASRLLWLALEYIERENTKGFVPDREMEYTNLYLVSQLEQSPDGSRHLRGRYLVAELWHYLPARGIKSCHQWTIWEDDPASPPGRASFRVLVEDFDNLVLGEVSQAPLDPLTLDRLGAFYREVKEFFARRSRDFPVEL